MRVLVILSSAMIAGAAPAAAQTIVPLPPADLGQTNILDGEGGPGGLLEVIAAGSVSNRVADAGGQAVPGDPEQRSATSILHPIYTSRRKLLGAWLGGEALVSLATVSQRAGAAPRRSATGFGDVTLAPFLQWSAPPSAPRGLSVRIGMQVVAPLGGRRAGRSINVGSGAWQVSPYVAATKRLGNGWETSGRVILDRSGTATSQGDGPPTRAGDFAVLNVSVSRAIDSAKRIGAGGYLLQQTGRSRVDGVATGDLQRVFAMGPVFRGQAGRGAVLLAAYAEFGARDRPQGFAANLRFQHPL